MAQLSIPLSQPVATIIAALIAAFKLSEIQAEDILESGIEIVAQPPGWTDADTARLRPVDRTIGFKSPEGKCYQLNEKTATLIVRPRGWHLVEEHMLVDGDPVSASLFDFGLFFFHNARRLIENGSGPYFYLPKMESHLEARWWDQVFREAEAQMGLAVGTIKATVLIETILAAFEMDEILYELREHSAGLNAGRWDYIFSAIKCFPDRPEMFGGRLWTRVGSVRRRRSGDVSVEADVEAADRNDRAREGKGPHPA